MVEYLSGNRIQGSSTKVTSPPQTSWKELGRTTLSSTSSDITVSSFTAKDNLMVLIYAQDGSQMGYRVNSDTGNNYHIKRSMDGASDSTLQSTKAQVHAQGAKKEFNVSSWINIANQEKLFISNTVSQNTAGAGNAPSRNEIVGKWANTSDQITTFTLHNAGSTGFSSGSEVVVLGYDNDESDSGTNFWQELANVELSSAGDTLDTSTITAKKYLWIQAFIPEGAGHHGYIYFNGDDGGSNNNYARRGSINGGNDITTTDDDEINWSHDTNTAKYLNMFVINISDKEKLCIAEYMDYGSSGAGNAPNRIEWVYKWANTSAQITSVKLYNNQASSNDFPIGTTLKVWGSD